MTLEEILAKIESDELKEAIVTKINEEKDKGIQSYTKKDKEVLKYKNALKDLGYDHEKYSDVTEFIESKKTVEQNVNESKLTIATLNDKLNDLTNKLDQERQQAEAIRRTAKENKLSAELTKTIGAEFYGADYLIKSLINEGKVDLDDATNQVFFKNGDDLVPFEKGIEQLKEQNRDMLKVTQSGGTGDKGGTGIPTTVDEDLLSKPANEVLDALGL